MKKVCHMTNVHSPEDVRIFHKECASLAKAGYDVYLLERGDSYEKNGVHIVGVGQPSGGRLSRMTSFAKKVYEAALEIDADIYHFHDPELLPWGLKLKKRGKKVIFDSHELYREQLRCKPYLPRWCTEVIVKGYTLYERRVLKRLDGVIFPCKINGKNPFEGLCRRAVLVNNVPLLSELYDRYDPAVEKRPRSVCYVGSLTYSRGITHVIMATHSAECTAYLAGTFSPSGYQAELEAMPEYGCVQYMGQLGRKQILELLQVSRIGICTLLNVGQYQTLDNLPTKAYEYMALGLPVIFTRRPYHEQVINRYHFGILVDPKNVDEIADAIRYLLDHPEEARQMGENGRRAVKEEFNWGVEEKKLLALYEDILKE